MDRAQPWAKIGCTEESRMTDHQRCRSGDMPAQHDDSNQKAPRRRASDATDQTAEPAHKRRRRKARDFFQRFREPLIGIGIAGALSPALARDGAKREELPASEEDKEESATERAPGEDLEDEISDRIAVTRADEMRTDTVTNAVDQYGIARDLAEDIYDQATIAGIEPKLAYGLVKTESAFRHNAISNVGARGLTQVMPRTAAWLRPGTRAQELEDRHINLSLGFKYLNQLINKYGGDVELALLAYNRGPGTVDRILKRGGDPDNGYARKVMGS
jgi:transglycosylase-like protein with SLT domain